MDKRSTEHAQEHIRGTDIVEELLPLMADFFEGKQEIFDGAMLLTFENGQRFVLRVDECR